MTVLERIFSYVCGSHHLWSPGGEALPFCQRCTGLYVGCALALALCVVFRPRPTLLVLGIHGLLLLLMVPFGYHLVWQNALIRTLTGQLFAFGLVYYLAFNPAAHLDLWGRNRRGNLGAYILWALAGTGALQIAVHAGGARTGTLLAWVGFAGLLGCAALVIANLVLLPPSMLRILLRRSAPSTR